MQKNNVGMTLPQSGPPDFQSIFKLVKESGSDYLNQQSFSCYFISSYNLDLIERLHQLDLLDYCISKHFLIALQNNQEVFIILSKIIYNSQYSIVVSKCYEIISKLLPISEIYASSSMYTVILERYKPLFPNSPPIQISANANEYPYIGLFIRGIEHESFEVRINALKCIRTHCMKYDSLFTKMIEYILDLLNDLKKDVQIYSMSFLLQVLKEKGDRIVRESIDLSFAFSFINHLDRELQTMAFKLYSYYIVDNKRQLINIIEQISKVDTVYDKYRLYKYMFKFSIRNQKMCREVSTLLRDSIKGSYDVFINRLISSILAGCDSITNNDAINLMIRDHWLNFMKITNSILIPFLNIYKSYNFPEKLSMNSLMLLYSCFKHVSLLDIYKFTCLNRYFNIIIKILNIFVFINQPVPDEEQRVEIADAICELIVEIIVLLSQYIKLSNDFRKQLLFLIYSLLMLHSTIPYKKRVISIYETIKSLCRIFNIELNLPQITYTTPNQVSQSILRDYNFKYVDYVGISNRIINKLYLSVKELTYLTFSFNSKYPLDVTVVYENKYLLKFNCLLHIFTSDNQINQVDKLYTMNYTKTEMPFYFSLKRTNKPINLTLNLIPDFPQCIINLSNLDNFRIFSCSYLIKPN